MNPSLLHYVTTGLLATAAEFRAGTLPAHRLARELRARVDILATLDPPARTLTRLRWLQRGVEHLHDSGAPADTLAAALTGLDGLLAELTRSGPDDPPGAGRRPGRAMTGHRTA